MADFSFFFHLISLVAALVLIWLLLQEKKHLHWIRNSFHHPAKSRLTVDWPLRYLKSFSSAWAIPLGMDENSYSSLKKAPPTKIPRDLFSFIHITYMIREIRMSQTKDETSPKVFLITQLPVDHLCQEIFRSRLDMLGNIVFASGSKKS